MTPGSYRVRLDQVDLPSGAVLARTEQNFDVLPVKLSAATPGKPNAVGQTVKLDARRSETLAKPPVSSLIGSSPSHVVVPKIETATVSCLSP